ncbi:MAG: cation-translocating P-type ATPase [Clostridia bacterium]|nr:cation-translocating P-type ATPase [Clostridia bacterium]
MEYHVLSINDAVRRLETDEVKGLTEAAAKKRLEKYGENRLREKRKTSVVLKFFLQFKDPMVITLIIAAGISFFTAYAENESFIDPIIILGIVILNAVVGVIQEAKAEQAIEKLKQLSTPKATVMRGGKEVSIPAAEIVPGDVLVLNTGDRVAADARLTQSVELTTDESSLTGEAHPCEKNAAEILAENIPLAEQKNTVFSSSTVLTGHGRAVVTATGMNTQLGRIADMLGTEHSPQTPLQQRLDKISKVLGISAVAICMVIFLMGMLRHDGLLPSFMLAISLAVAAIPEGLPAVVTIVLSTGLGRMAKAKAIVRKLTAVEALGSATYICSDKTGTLTQNKMTVCRLFTPENETDFSREQAKEILGYAALCCNATAESGEPTEKAIVAAAKKESAEFSAHRLSEIPFNSTDKMMSVTVKMGNTLFAVTKGAPEKIFPLCTNCGNAKYFNDAAAAEGLRVLAVAVREMDEGNENIRENLRLLGLICIEDPERKEAKQAVKICKQAGITPVMITGDNPKTAFAIAKRLGIAEEKTPVITGTQLDRLSEKELQEKVKSVRVFARVSPEHKVRIVKALQANGEVTAMTGDGVNDAPALKAADIGCAMGRSGTEVAKGAADIVLADDNFATIVRAVEEGRGIYDNIKKVVRFLISSNIGEIMLIFIAGLMRLEAPMLPIQLLWTNLVTDSLPGMALGVEKREKDIMKRKPVKPDAGLFTKGGWFDIVLEGVLIGAPALLGFILGNGFWGIDVARSICFCIISIAELLHALNSRSENSLFKIGLFSNIKMVGAFLICLGLQVAVVTVPALCTVFKTVPLNGVQWLTVAALSLFVTASVELSKLLTSRRK